MRQMRAQLRAKCESAPLRATVTEPATRSTLTAVICKKTYKHKELRLSVVVIGNSHVLVDEASGAAGVGAPGWAARTF
jgi:hypothetical protein